MRRYVFDNKSEFTEKLRELVGMGISGDKITTVSPYPVHEVDELVGAGPSSVRVFALLGALSGLVIGFAFTIYTAKDWPLISGGKPLVAIPAFLIIAFVLTILFGSLSSFIGFLCTARLPEMQRVISREDFTNQFEIYVEDPEDE